MTDTLFIENDGSTQSFPENCSVAAHLYFMTRAKSIRAIHQGGSQIVVKNGVPVAEVECSRSQFLESI